MSNELRDTISRNQEVKAKEMTALNSEIESLRSLSSNASTRERMAVAELEKVRCRILEVESRASDADFCREELSKVNTIKCIEYANIDFTIL